jgi:iron complex transport system ATP-binding protein
VTAIEVRDLTVVLGGKPVVNGVDATVAEGEWIALIGPNGAGKTTLLRAMAGLVPFTGEVALRGRSIRELGRTELARIVAVVPQEPSTPPWMTVGEYVLLGRTPHVGTFSRESRHDRLAAALALARLDLSGYEERRLETLSGGEKQRAVVARALAQDARIVLLDEPMAALDIGHQQQALELVARLRREHGLTVVSAMHDLTLAGLYSDRLALLHEGRCVAAGRAQEVLQAGTLAEFYGVQVNIHHEPDGTVVVIPRRAPV